ncbi:MAG TPA: S-layer protein domain-containing protein [Methanothrix soehngenii]|nr:S-layer protein domain-containing protein [Methanothrix soehngenii]
MKKLAAITFTSMVLLLATAMAVGAADSVEIRGKVATGTDTWTADDFAGFYYDLDDDIKTEELTATVTEGNKLMEPDGVVYTTKVMADDFDYEAWGSYNVIGFMADKYFAGYIDTPDSVEDVLFEESDDENVLSDEQLLKILMDNDDERTVTSGTPLAMEEGYELSIAAIDIDGNKVYLELSKDGAVVDSKVISPSKDGATMKDKTYYYKKDIGDSKDVVIVAAHFKNAFRGADQNLATVDGLWQLSDTPQDVSENTEYDKMTIQTVTANTITMNNEDNDITLSKNKDITLMPGISIKTADSDDDALRYYLYKEITEPGTYEIRGNVATDTFTWTADNFAGFYYDIDDDIKTEELTATISEGDKLLEPDGVTYTSTAQANEFEFEEWGTYNVIGFFADKYFAGYIDDPNVEENVLFDESEDENVLADEQLLKILMDNDDERTVTSGTPLAMEEGYELSIQSIDIDGNKVYLELSKDGAVVDSKVISPSADNAGMKDKTYYYKKDIGDSKDVVIVAAHFKNAFRGADQNLATVDGLWQLSDTPQDVSENTEYDKMTIQTVTANTITMNNEDNDITLSKNKDISLMPGVSIKTADDDELRYYIYKEATIEGEEEVAEEEPAVVAPVNATEKTVEEAKEAVEEANKTVEEAKEVVEEAKEEVAEAEAKAEEAAEVPANQTPGFGSIFALTGLLAVAYLVLSRRD